MQNRMDAPIELRRQSRLTDSEDVERDEQIVLEDESGKNEMGSRT